ncbi:MAG: helicase-related protein, partial [Patescibacteria group bacterium]
KQHFKSITKMLKDFDVSIAFLTGKEYKLCEARPRTISEVKRKELLEKLANGQVDILIGTHALISKGVEFKNLALVVLDEQHRFGVSQRSALTQSKDLVPHLLSMTATPIPRTLALTVYGDLDLSLIKEMPKDRKKIKTIIVEPGQRKQAYNFIESEVKKGRGVFVICPKIEPSDKRQGTRDKGQIYGSFVPQNYKFNILNNLNEIKSVKQEYEKLSKEIFPNLKIAVLYGKMKPKEKEKIMIDFADGKTDILLSTSVVEVGIDVPRATVMMIEGAERFGLAQLHQFRGRVGRSDMQSYCFLFTTDPSQLNRKRLKALVESNNGFELAQKDLEIRGPGQLYGSQQWGLPDMAMQGLSNIFLVEKTRADAKELLEKDPELKNYPLLKERAKKFNQRIHFE